MPKDISLFRSLDLQEVIGSINEYFKPRPRDPKRIKEVVGLINKLRDQAPDQRFFQFIHNLNSRICRLLGTDDRDLYWLEDTKLITILTWFLEDDRKSNRL